MKKQLSLIYIIIMFVTQIRAMELPVRRMPHATAKKDEALIESNFTPTECTRPYLVITNHTKREFNLISTITGMNLPFGRVRANASLSIDPEQVVFGTYIIEGINSLIRYLFEIKFDSLTETYSVSSGGKRVEHRVTGNCLVIEIIINGENLKDFVVKIRQIKENLW